MLSLIKKYNRYILLTVILLAFISFSFNKATNSEYPQLKTNSALQELLDLRDSDIIKLNYIDYEKKEHTLRLEVARSTEKHLSGLMFREELNDIDGMIFIFEIESIRNFWMKNSLIPLDIIFLDHEFRSTAIYQNTKTNQIDETYSSITPIFYVIELESQTSTTKGFRLNEKIFIKNINIL